MMKAISTFRDFFDIVINTIISLFTRKVTFIGRFYASAKDDPAISDHLRAMASAHDEWLVNVQQWAGRCVEQPRQRADQ